MRSRKGRNIVSAGQVVGIIAAVKKPSRLGGQKEELSGDPIVSHGAQGHQCHKPQKKNDAVSEEGAPSRSFQDPIKY
jgi:hypothetical protein